MFKTSPSSTTYVLPSSRWRPRLAASACEPASTRSSQRITSARMKPRAMSVWIVSAASSAVRPRRSDHARVSFSPAVKKLINPSSSLRRRTTSSRAEAPSRKPAASASDMSASSASNLRSIPFGPFSTASSGLVVSGSRPAGSSPGQSARVPPASTCASTRPSSSTSFRSWRSPDFACLVTRSRRRSTWSRSATSSSRLSVSRSSAGTRVPEKPSSTTRSASTCRRFPSNSGPVPLTSTTRSAAGVTLRGLMTPAIFVNRGSGTPAMPTSPVACAPVSAWNSVDLPELGSPTIPTSRAKLGLRVSGDLLLQRHERPVLQRLDRALGLVEDRRDFGVRQVEHELQREDLLLLRREVLDQLEHALPADHLHRRGLGGGLALALGLGHLFLRLPAAVRAEVIHRKVVRDAEEPGGQRRGLPLEALDRLEHLHERLRRQILRVVPIPDAHVEVAVDAVEVKQVELFEGLPVALLAAVDELPHVGGGVGRGPCGGLDDFFSHSPGEMPLLRRPQSCAAEPNPTRLSRAKRFT